MRHLVIWNELDPVLLNGAATHLASTMCLIDNCRPKLLADSSDIANWVGPFAFKNVFASYEWNIVVLAQVADAAVEVLLYPRIIRKLFADFIDAESLWVASEKLKNLFMQGRQAFVSHLSLLKYEKRAREGLSYYALLRAVTRWP